MNPLSKIAEPENQDWVSQWNPVSETQFHEWGQAVL